jgi:hypothetical protein
VNWTLTPVSPDPGFPDPGFPDPGFPVSHFPGRNLRCCSLRRMGRVLRWWSGEMKCKSVAYYLIYAPPFILILASFMLPFGVGAINDAFMAFGYIGLRISLPSMNAVYLFNECNPDGIYYGYLLSLVSVIEVPFLFVAFIAGFFDSENKYFEVNFLKICIGLLFGCSFVYLIYFDGTLSRRSVYFICNNGTHFAVWSAIGMAGGLFVLANVGRRLRPLVDGWLSHL